MNTWKDVMSVIVVAKNIDGEIIGNVTRRNRCHGPAPSRRAASRICSGIASRADEKTNMLYPKPCQTLIAMTANMAHPCSPRKFGACAPVVAATVLSISPPGW
jgi:hypothetical protein